MKPGQAGQGGTFADFPDADSAVVDDDVSGAGDPQPRRAPALGRGLYRYQVPAFIEMLISSLIGLTASLVLSIDAVRLAADPYTELSCNISSTINCAKVGLTWQANLLGFPNAFLGLIAEPVVITVAVAALGGVRFPRWFMLCAQCVYSIGLVFAYWLFYQAYFHIHALCPWCLLITITTTLVFFSMTRVNILEGNLGPKLQARLAKPLRIGVDSFIAAILLGILASMVVARYI
ncbi:MAG: vitamin K epoxide reductase family protein [Candidatus Nanopelagicales bacterium]